MNTEKFKIPQSILKVASLEDLKFIFVEAKDKLSETTEEANQLYQRSVLILSLAITILTTIIGYLATHLYLNVSNIILAETAIILCVICSIIKPNIKPAAYYTIGTIPYSITLEGYFKDLDGKTPEWYHLVLLIEAYDERIVINKNYNDERAINITAAIKWLFWIPALAFMTLLTFFLFDML